MLRKEMACQPRAHQIMEQRRSYDVFLYVHCRKNAHYQCKSTFHSTTLPSLALEHRGAGARVRLGARVQVEQNPRVGRLVRTGERNCRRRLARAGARDVDLRTLHVELGTGLRAGRVQRNQLAAEEVLAWRNAGGDCDRLLALVLDQTVDAPCGTVEGVFGDLRGGLVHRVRVVGE
jgi:hypothetical protein